MYFGSPNNSVVKSFLAFGIIGAAITYIRNRNNVIGFVSVRTKVIDKKNNELIVEKLIHGKSKIKNKNDLTMYEAYNHALTGYAENVLRLISEIK